MPWPKQRGTGRRRIHLRDATLTPEYLRHLREASLWLLSVVRRLGGSIESTTSSREVDKGLERAVEWSYAEGEKM